MYKCKHFEIKELVSPAVYNQFGEFAWSFFGEDVLKDLDIIRQEWGSPLTINNWSWSGQYKESGLRCNVDSIVKNKKRPYLSGHVLGKAFDLKPANISDAKKLYYMIIKYQKRFNSIKRLEGIEKTPTWVHVDGLNTSGNSLVVF